MRGIIGILAAIGAAAVLVAPAAAAPSRDARPVNYPSELNSDLLPDQYPTVSVVLQPVDTAAIETTGVLGAQKTVVRKPLAAATQRGTLPFTGAPVSLLVLIGGMLLGSGLLLRTSARGR